MNLQKRTNNTYHIFRTLNNAKKVVVEDENDINAIRSIETFTHRIIHACSINDIDAAEKLIKYGTNQFRKLDETKESVTKRLVDSADYDRRTCVHLAAAEGHEEILSFLLENGASTHPKDRWGNTPLHEVRKAIRHLDQLHSAVGYIATQEESALRSATRTSSSSCPVRTGKRVLHVRTACMTIGNRFPGTILVTTSMVWYKARIREEQAPSRPLPSSRSPRLPPSRWTRQVRAINLNSAS